MIYLIILVLSLCTLTVATVSAGVPTPEKGHQGYIEYYQGTIPLIFTTPHGGSMKPVHILDRTAGCWDSRTMFCTYDHTCGIPDPDK